MTWMWWLLIPAVLGILLFCPIYLYAYYDGQFRLAVRFLFIKIYIPLDKAKTDKKPEKKKKKPKKPEKTKTDGESFLSQLNHFKDMIVSSRTHILKAFRIKRFKADITAASDDPCKTALLFGGINAAAFIIVSFIDTLVTVDKRDISVSVDYNASKTAVYVDVILRTFLYKLLIGLILFAIDGTIKSKEQKEN